MQIPILNGIYTDSLSDFRTSYPRNMVPVPKQQGISEGYLRPADGIIEQGVGSGPDRGAISWNGVCYRVLGSTLISIDANGVAHEIGSVGPGGQVSMDYSFDKLAISSGGRLYYLTSGGGLQSVTDTDLGAALDVVWIAGYFMTTDGTSLVVTELNDPTSVNPLKYGSSEADPDSIKGILKLRNEVYAVNRHTIEVFQNVGGANFPFQRIDGAQIQRGALGKDCMAVVLDSIAFLGGGRNEAPGIWLGSNGASAQISTREINQILRKYTEQELSNVLFETRVYDSHQLLYVHLPDMTWVYDAAASQTVSDPVWFCLTTGSEDIGVYRGRNFIWCYGKWLCGDPVSGKYGYVVNDISSHYGILNTWEFGTNIVYNDGRGAIFHELELVCLTGRVTQGSEPLIGTSYTLDGQTWSQEHYRKAGGQGERLKRLTWLRQGAMRHWRCQKFKGTSDAHISVARLEARIEALNV